MHFKDIDLIVSHGGCPDGLVAAWAGWKKLKEIGKEVEIYFAYHGDDVPYDKFVDKNIYMVDFAYDDPETLLKIINLSRSFTLHDHHKSAQEKLATLSTPGHEDVEIIFDMNESGASLAWKFFHKEQPMPKLVEHIRDRDLWTWNDDNSEAFLANFDSYPRNFETCDLFSNPAMYEKFLEEGEAILRYKNQLIETGIKHGRLMNLKLPVGPMRRFFRSILPGNMKKLIGKKVKVYAVNNTSKTTGSEIGSIMANSPGGVDVSVVWSYDQESESIVASLRSKRTDVSKLAGLFGGGGHKNAAGMLFKGQPNELFEPLL